MVVLCYWSQWSVDKMVSYFIGGVMVSILALSVLDPWDRAPEAIFAVKNDGMKVKLFLFQYIV